MEGFYKDMKAGNIDAVYRMYQKFPGIIPPTYPTTTYGNTLLAKAILVRNVDVVQYLLQLGATVNTYVSVDDNLPRIPLLLAPLYTWGDGVAHPDEVAFFMIELLLERGDFNPEFLYDSESTLLHVLVGLDVEEIPLRVVELFLRYGVRKEAVNDEGDTAFNLASLRSGVFNTDTVKSADVLDLLRLAPRAKNPNT